METLSYEVEDVHDGLMRYADSFEFDERALDAMQSRLAAIDKLKRKYGLTIEEILAFLAKAKGEYERLDQSESCWRSFRLKSSGRNRACGDRPNVCFRCGGKQTPRSVRPWKRPFIN